MLDLLGCVELSVLTQFLCEKSIWCLTSQSASLGSRDLPPDGPIGELPGQVFSVRYFVFETHGSISE